MLSGKEQKIPTKYAIKRNLSFSGQRYKHSVKSVLENKTHNVMWNIDIQLHQLIQMKKIGLDCCKKV